MKTLLVTGGCGFIGSNFIRYVLEETDFSGLVVNVDKLTYAGNPRNLDGIPERFGNRYTFVRADIADADAMGIVFSRHCPDKVCHFAAESHVDRAILDPEAFVLTNVLGTFRLLEAARRHKGTSLFLHVSTDEVFGSLGPEGVFTEDSPYLPNSPYAAAKAGSDHLVRAYFKTYGLAGIISHCGNNYGPYQFPEKLVPLVIENALEGRPIPVYGKGDNVRDWIFVRDHCAALWQILQKGVPGQTYNIGGHGETSNLAIVHQICDAVDQAAGPLGSGPRRNLVHFVKDRPGHDFRYALDSQKIRQDLGWTPEQSLESGIRSTVAWYLRNRDWVLGVKNGEYREWIARQYGPDTAS